MKKLMNNLDANGHMISYTKEKLKDPEIRDDIEHRKILDRDLNRLMKKRTELVKEVYCG